MSLRNEFVEAARQYLGTRWVHQGRSIRGVDCVGLLIVSGADIGVTIPDMKGYRRTPQPHIFVTHIRDNSDPQIEPLPGYMGIFRDGSQPCHVGIFAERHGRTSLIHAYAGTGKVMEEPFEHHWPNRLMEIRSIKGIS